MATLIKAGDYMGALLLTGDILEGAAYLEYGGLSESKNAFHKSIVTHSIASTMQGEFAVYQSAHGVVRLEGIASSIRFASAIEKSETMREVANAFQIKRITRPHRAAQLIPLK
jgi:hypothetical protein